MNETSKILESGIQSTPFLLIKRASPTPLSQLPTPPGPHTTVLISQSRHPFYPIHIPYPLISTLKMAAECYSRHNGRSLQDKNINISNSRDLEGGGEQNYTSTLSGML